jgi:hypothetical protein
MQDGKKLGYLTALWTYENGKIMEVGVDRLLGVQMMAKELNVDGETASKIWAQRKFVQRLFQKVCLMSRNSGSLILVLISVVNCSQETNFWIMLSLGDEWWCFKCDSEMNDKC